MMRFSIIGIIACVGLLFTTDAVYGKDLPITMDVNVVNTMLPVTVSTPIEVTVPPDIPLPVTVSTDTPIPVTASTAYQFAGYSVATTMPTSGIVLMHRICQESYGLTARMCTSKEFWTSPQLHFPVEQYAWIHPSIVGYANVDGVLLVADFSGAQVEMGHTTCSQWTYSGGSWEINGMALRGQYSNIITPIDCDQPREVTCCTPANQ